MKLYDVFLLILMCTRLIREPNEVMYGLTVFIKQHQVDDRGTSVSVLLRFKEQTVWLREIINLKYEIKRSPIQFQYYKF
jgi:hypothetical protein